MAINLPLRKAFGVCRCEEQSRKSNKGHVAKSLQDSHSKNLEGPDGDGDGDEDGGGDGDGDGRDGDGRCAALMGGFLQRRGRVFHLPKVPSQSDIPST